MTLPTTDVPLSLAAEFPRATQAQWRKLVEAALKGADFDKRLVHETYDGIRVEPLYPRAEHARPVAGRAAGPWQLLQRVDHPDPAIANAEALEDLANGASGLKLVFAGSCGAYGYGLQDTEAAIARVLDGVQFDAGIAIECELSSQAREAPARIAKLIAQRGIDPAKTDFRAGFDPLGLMARRGGSPASWDEIAPLLTTFARDLATQGFAGPFAAADGRWVHSAGGSEAQELAFALGNAVAYLRALTDNGTALAQARRMIFFRLAADADQFLTMAKFRAVRKLWMRVEEACGLKPEPVFVSAETAWRMMTRRDPYVNLLRSTIAVTAAGLGGAEAVTALPFTQALGLPDRFARRLARNMQLILLEESSLAKVRDPAAGSGGIEAITTRLCESAWALFQEIERAGGAAQAIERGLVQEKVAAVRQKREAAVARRKDAITGTSDYPNLSEATLSVLNVPRVQSAPLPAKFSFPAMPEMRLAEPFELLRDASDRTLAQTGRRPKVFLANLGKLSDFNARATFAKNFYEAGGIEAVGSEGFTGRVDMVVEFKASGARIACLCSSDKVYAVEGAEAARALSNAGAIVHLAGRPGELEADLRQAGVKSFVFIGCDALATLQAAHDSLGVR